MEHIPFLSHPQARLTKALERTIPELRQHMSIQFLADFYNLRNRRRGEKTSFFYEAFCVAAAKYEAQIGRAIL